MDVTAADTRKCALGTAVLGIIPGTAAYVFVGGAVATTTQNISEGGGACDSSGDAVSAVLRLYWLLC